MYYYKCITVNASIWGQSQINEEGNLIIMDKKAESTNSVKKWSFNESSMRYITVSLGGGGLILGAFFPWLHSAQIADVEGGFRAGIDSFSGNIGVITLILGFLAFAGLYERPFGIQQRFYLGSVAISSLLVTIGFFEFSRNLVDNEASDATLSPGIWITLIGAGILTLGFIGTLGQERKTMGKEPRPSKCAVTYLALLPTPAILATLTLAYDTSSIENSAFLSYREPGITTTIILVLLVTTAVITSLSGTKLNPPAILYMFLSAPLVAITSPFIFRGFNAKSQDHEIFHGGGAANWFVFITAIFMLVISVRAARQKQEA